MMKIKKTFSKLLDRKTISRILENKYVLYFVFILAIIHVFGYMITGNFNSIIFFGLIGFLTSFFSKNMIIVLSVPLILTSIFMLGKTIKEGFESTRTIEDVDKDISNTREKIKNLAKTDIKGKKERDELNKLLKKMDDLQDEKAKLLKSSDEESKPKPRSKNGSDDSDSSADAMSTMYNKPNRIDYASTVEDAYEDLNKILGGDGIKRLTDDTQKLMSQQLQLADAMKGMTPLMEQAKSLLQGFDLKNLGGLGDLTKNLPVGAAMDNNV